MPRERNEFEMFLYVCIRFALCGSLMSEPTSFARFLAVRDQVVMRNRDQHRQMLAPGCAATRSRAAFMISGPTIEV